MLIRKEVDMQDEITSTPTTGEIVQVPIQPPVQYITEYVTDFSSLILSFELAVAALMVGLGFISGLVLSKIVNWWKW